MNNQEAFDKMVTHLFTQKARAQNTTGSCFYRMPDSNNKCAVGVLIPDDEYSPDIEGEGARTIQGRISALADLSTGLLEDMQEIHDARPYPVWYRACKEAAREHKLDTSVLEAFQDVDMDF